MLPECYAQAKKEYRIMFGYFLNFEVPACLFKESHYSHLQLEFQQQTC